MMKKIFIVIWLLGAVLLFSFRTPVKYEQFFGAHIVTYSHIFTQKGMILWGQVLLYLFIWSTIIFLAYRASSGIKRRQ